jgi:cytochrome c-type biogenesis protein CcmH
MLLWLGFAVLAAAVVAAIVRPLVTGGETALDSATADMAVYRDQMAEIARDRERGLIGEAEAEAARAEVARRLLARETKHHATRIENKAPASCGATAGVPGSALAIAAMIPLVAIGTYLRLGSPGLPAQPHEARLQGPAEKSGLDELVAKVERRLREKPDDGQGWDVIAPVYMMQQRYQDAAQAFGRAIALLGESPKRLSGFAEAQVLAANGMVVEAARSAYERLRALEPNRHEPRFWLALAKEQDGQLEAAAAEYDALLASAPSDAPWREMVEARLQEIKGQSASGGSKPGPATGGGPRTEDVEAAAKLSPEERAAMIERMVGGLADRLKANGKDLAGWVKLVRAYMVLGRNKDAAEALASARGALAGDNAALAELETLARSLGLGT